MPSARPKPHRRGRAATLPPELRRVNLNAAGVDVGAGSHYVAVPDGRDPEGCDVREFRAFTADLYALADWLTRCDIETVAMESTGVYWIPLFELLSERGFEVRLVDPRQLKSVPGRKTDVLDCQWIQQLHTFGLLAAAFRPDDQICVLRSYLRQRAMLVTYAAHHIQHMQKALEQMNLKLAHVVSDITGVTGLAIIRAILGGQRDPRALATLRDPHCKTDAATIARALEGTWRPEHLFELRQALELVDFYHDADRRLRSGDRGPAPAIRGQARGPAPGRRAPPAEGPTHGPGLRCAPAPPSPHGRRSHPDRGDRRAHGPQGGRRDRARHDPVAHREAFRLLAQPCAWQQGLRGQAAQRPDQTLGQPRGGRAPFGRQFPLPQSVRPRRLPPPPESPPGRSQGDHRHRA